MSFAFSTQFLLILVELLSYLSKVHCIARYGSQFICRGRNECYDDQIHCDNNIGCSIECNGANACQYAVIHCPINAECHITCNGGIDACKDVLFLSKKSSSLSIICDPYQSESCDETVIYCPNNGRGGTKTCSISGVSPDSVKTKMEIFAVEGLNDVSITGTYANNLHLYCKNDYSSPCTLRNSSPFNQCISNDKTCETYLQQIPIATSKSTTNPTTKQPTTKPPTTKPPTTKSITTKTSTTKTPTTKTPTTKTPTTNEPTLGPTLGATPRPTLRPTQITPRPTRAKLTPRPSEEKLVPLFTTTAEAAGFGIISNTIFSDPNTDSNGINNNEKYDDFNSQTKGSNLNPLYYVITALLTSICYISCSLFCWVHYNHKYTKKVIDLRNNSNSEYELSPSHRLIMISQPPETQMVGLNDKHCHRSRYQSASVASAATAPTTISNHSETNPPTTTIGGDVNTRKSTSNSSDDASETATETATTSSSTTSETSSSSSSSYSDSDCYHNQEFKEVDYETGAQIIEEEEDEQQDQQQGRPQTKLTIDSMDMENTTIHDDESMMQYGEQIVIDGPKQTHNLKISNLSDLNVNNYGDCQNDPIYTWQPIMEQHNDDDEFKEVDYETCAQKQEQEPLHSSPPIVSPQIKVNQSISLSGIGYNGNGVLQQWQQQYIPPPGQ